MTYTRSIRRSALAIAIAALTGVAFAQSGSSGSTSGGSPGTSGATSGGPSTSTPGAAGGGMGTSGGSTGSMATPGASGSTPSATGSAMKMPSRSEPADSAYRALDHSNRGYLQKSDVAGLQDFNFDQADTNHDGRISKDEFARYWSQKPAK
jgi:hypothetical protein